MGVLYLRTDESSSTKFNLYREKNTTNFSSNLRQENEKLEKEKNLKNNLNKHGGDQTGTISVKTMNTGNKAEYKPYPDKNSQVNFNYNYNFNASVINSNNPNYNYTNTQSKYNHDKETFTPAGSNYDLILPEVGVTLIEGMKKKGGEKDYFKKYKKYSKYDYFSMARENNSSSVNNSNFLTSIKESTNKNINNKNMNKINNKIK